MFAANRAFVAPLSRDDFFFVFNKLLPSPPSSSPSAPSSSSNDNNDAAGFMPFFFAFVPAPDAPDVVVGGFNESSSSSTSAFVAFAFAVPVARRARNDIARDVRCRPRACDRPSAANARAEHAVRVRV
jgi:hypothetical protein